MNGFVRAPEKHVPLEKKHAYLQNPPEEVWNLFTAEGTEHQGTVLFLRWSFITTQIFQS